jgi:hypothetical protein
MKTRVNIHVQVNTNPAHAINLNADVLFEQAIGTPPSVHQAYLCCATSQWGPRIFCIHAPSCFVSALHGRITPWDNNCYAYLGDVTQEIATSVVCLSTVLTLCLQLQSTLQSTKWQIYLP